MKVEFYRHALSDEDRAASLEVMQSIFLSAGPQVSRFEEKFAAYTGLTHCVALNSCTAALHLALLALDIGPGDEVITTPMTFISSANAVLYTGATPVLADVDPATGLLDPDLVAAKITPRTKAILPVHMYGTMADMVKLRALADEHGLYIVEDSAHCIEGRRDGVRPGQLGDIVCYSFYATKNLTCGEGGAIGTNSLELAQKVRSLRQHGMSREAAQRYTGTYQHWDMVALGWKYNLNDILAALMIHQIDRLDHQHDKRVELFERYNALIDPIDNVRRPQVAGRSAHHLYTVWVNPAQRDNVLHALQQAGIGVAVNYRAIHNLSYYHDKYAFTPDSFPHADLIGRCTITLPFYISLRPEEQEYVANSLAQAVK